MLGFIQFILIAQQYCAAAKQRSAACSRGLLAALMQQRRRCFSDLRTAVFRNGFPPESLILHISNHPILFPIRIFTSYPPLGNSPQRTLLPTEPAAFAMGSVFL